MQCSGKKDTPYDIISGSATTDSNTAYFRSHLTGSFYSYNINHDEWGEPPPPPSKDYGLVYIEGQVTTVGGINRASHCITDQLFTLQDGKWKERHPLLNFARFSPAAVSTYYDGRKYVIVVGGRSAGGDWITSVEVLSNNKWYQRNHLPDNLQFPLATVCNTTLYVISGISFIGYSISLRDLLVDTRPMKCRNSPLILPWTRLPRLPLHLTTPVSMCGEFLIVGGRDGHNEHSSAIYQLWNNQFVEIGHMSEARSECSAVTPSPDKMVVVGGRDQHGMTAHKVEELSVV